MARRIRRTVGVLILAAPVPGVAADADCARAESLLAARSFDAALAASSACETGARRTSDDRLVARALIVRGSVLLARIQPLDSLTPLREAIAAAERARDGALLSIAHARLAESQGRMGDWSAMIDSGRRALEANPTDAVRVSVLTARGRAFMELRDRAQAERAFLEAIGTARRIRDRSAIALIEREMGLVYWRIDRDRGRALASYESAIRHYRRVGDAPGLIATLNLSGNVFRATSDYAEAERRYGEGLTIAARMGVVDAYLLKNQGIVFRETGRRADAERLLLAAVAAADRQQVTRGQWQARMELGVLYRDSDPARALRYFEECLDVLEARHANVLLDDFSAGALSGEITIQSDPYDLYVAALLRQGRREQALAVAERARARAFLDTLSASRQSLANRIPAAYVARERELLKDARRNEDALQALRLQLSAEHPEIAHARYTRIASARDIQSLLEGPDEAVLEFFVGPTVSALWVIRRDRLDVVTLAAKQDLDAVARAYIETLSGAETPYEKTGRAAAALLIGDAMPLLGGVRRLIVIPHGLLHYLPFETLIGPGGRFLVEDYAISYAPSASTLAYLRTRAVPSRERVLAIGHPRLDDAALRPLPHTGREIDAVAATYRGAVDVLQREAATEAALTGANPSRAAILHIATHGLIDEERPQRSGLALTPAAASDGLLQMREIYDLRLNAALVTLSACETARGKQITGEGIVGLSRAFFYAGAHAVMASLWNVNDASTADFMTRFYASLRSGRAIDEAARDGKLAFIESGGRLRHPRYWGAFVVSGTARRAVEVSSPRDTIVRAGAVAGIVLTGLLAYAVHARRRVR